VENDGAKKSLAVFGVEFSHELGYLDLRKR
jgi:hypothetical protein